MAKASGWQLPLDQVRLQARGRFQIVMFRGVPYAKAWPRKRGKRGTPAQMQARADFRRMVEAVNGMSVEDHVGAMELAAGTEYTWRDVLSALVTGGFVEAEGMQMITTQAALDAITSVIGSVLVRAPEGWIGLAPGGLSQVLTIVAGAPAWDDLPTPGDPTPPGLYSQAMSALPTSANTGLETWLNQGSASVSNSAAGIAIDAPSAGLNVRGRRKASATGIYTALVALNAPAGNGNAVGIGFYDGTNKMQLLQINYFNGYAMLVGNYNSPTSYSGNAASTAANLAALAWLQVELTASDVFFRYSFDGSNFITLFSTSKAAGFLGASGYSNVLFFVTPQGSQVIGTLMSWVG